MKILNFGSLNIDHVYKVPHFVKKGETLSVIARKYKMNWRTLQKFNNMNDRDVARLKIGQKIMIPKK
mgnify:CR=1 FL=1